MVRGGKIMNVNKSMGGAVQAMSGWWAALEKEFVEDNSNEYFDYISINRDNGSEGVDLNTSFDTFRVRTQGNDAFVPSESYFELAFNILRKDNGNAYTDAATDITFGGTPLSLFKEMTHRIGGVLLERVDYVDLYAIIENLVNNCLTKQNKAFFRPDTGNNALTLEADSRNISNGLYNKAFVNKIGTPRNAKKRYNFRIPLKMIFRFFRYNPIACFGQEHQIDVRYNNTDERIHRGANPIEDGTIKINKLILWAAICKPDSEVYEDLFDKMLKGSETLFKWEGVDVFQKTFDQSNISWNITDSATKVQRVFIIARGDTQLTDQTKNGYINHPSLQITSAKLKYNNKTLVQEQYEINNGDCIRLYHEYLRCAGKGMCSMDSAYLTYDEFKNNYRILSFDLSQLGKDILANTTHASVNVQLNYDKGGIADNINLTAVVYNDMEARFTFQNGAMRPTDVTAQ